MAAATAARAERVCNSKAHGISLGACCGRPLALKLAGERGLAHSFEL
jgi:hypothetical protein